MRRWNRWVTDDEGSAALEFITVGLILLVPLVYLIAALGVIQEQTLGVEAAARHTARVISLAPDADAAVARSEQVLAGIVEEYGLDADAVDVSLSCVPAASGCPTAGATVTVTVLTRVSLPLMPSLFGLDRSTAIPVEASAVQKISRLWGGG
ncbi:Flp pilus assembly protein TadG [Microbacterium natoriense]|uniref:Flp pilus assembly protein TadG n=1 Tax=Microbacterium natoriense TaxID=284570 RepID=A0AAW8F1D6_9MICO|nr:TadE family protein [Microbacterium natoriense]MDQ0648924.1 Flp pilus assembly protein TadG [Microbacterium natoriense]